MRALFAKELRSLTPVFLFLVFMLAGDFVERAMTARPDQLSWVEVSSDLAGEGGTFAFVLLPLALAVAYAAFPREHDERTIELLYSLPIARTTIFLTKVAAGVTVLVASIAIGALSEGLQQAANPQTFYRDQWRPDVAASVVLLRSAFAVVIYAHGLLASVFRRFGLVPLVLAGFVIHLLETFDPSFAFLDPSNLLHYEFDGHALVLPIRELAIHLGAATISMLLAALAWLGPVASFGELLATLGRTLLGRFALGCGTTIVVVLVIGFVGYSFAGDEDFASEEDDEEARLVTVSFAVAEARTAHYHARYPSNLRARAAALLARADAIHDRVRAALGAGEVPEIEVDLTERSPEHLGIAGWSTMRVGLADLEDPDELAYVFAHETAHVFQGRTSDQGHTRVGGFFSEGSADYVAFEAVPRPEARLASRRLAALARERHDIAFEDAADRERLRRSFDGALEYPLGESFAAALEATCGAGAIGRLLRALAEPDAPSERDVRVLHQDLLQRIGCDLEAALGRWGSDLAAVAASERAALDAVPRLGAGVDGADEEDVYVRVVVDRPAPPGSTLWVKVRHHAAVEDVEIRAVRADAPEGAGDTMMLVPRAWVSGRRIEIQPGIEVPSLSRPYFERWRSVEVPE